ncbi:MAG: DUF6972 family protein [Spirulinaceae cyanobacterium]
MTERDRAFLRKYQERYGLYFAEPIGYRISKDETKISPNHFKERLPKQKPVPVPPGA